MILNKGIPAAFIDSNSYLSPKLPNVIKAANKIAKGDTNDDDFLYCLPDNKEISVCREMTKNMGFPKLEAGLSTM